MMNNHNEHVSVLLKQTIEALAIKPDGIYVDCTTGRGGHSELILEKLINGKLICIDRDIEAINYVKNKFKDSGNVYYCHSSFSKLKQLMNELNIDKLDGILFDLGVSSPQLDNHERGFSYHADAKLDMRMDQSQKVSAYDIVNSYDLRQLITMFKTYGDCSHAVKVANAIITYRNKTPIETTLELTNIIKNALPVRELYTDKHPARTYYQAIRIVVNNEREEIISSLEQAVNLLRTGGKLVVISFHSLEDSWVKQTLKKYLSSPLPSYLPISENMAKPLCKQIKADKTSAQEVSLNKRARSSKMHIIERN